MRLGTQEAAVRLGGHDHAILCTRHPSGEVDAVPVTFTLDDEGFLGVPVDLVKPKASQYLQRERNLESDPRATLLAEHWDDADWSKLWWVRARLQWLPDADPGRVADLSARLAARYRQYRDEPFARLIILRIVALSGWSAEGG